MDKEGLLRSVRRNLGYLAHSYREKESLNNIIDAIKVIDRRFFVSNEEDAYFDTALSIGYNQTISQPSTVARMLLLAELKSDKDVLELGAGSGWNASLAGFLVYPGRVLSLDIVPQLIEKAENNLKKLKTELDLLDRKRLNQVEFRLLNIFKELDIWPEEYDRLIITAGINPTQEILIFQLAKKLLREDGILVCPYTSGPLIILKKERGEISMDTTREHYAFVPLLD